MERGGENKMPCRHYQTKKNFFLILQILDEPRVQATTAKSKKRKRKMLIR